MAIQLSTTVRNAMLDAMESAIGTSAKIFILTGAQPSNCASAQTGTKLVEFDLASDWAANASSGSKAFNSITGTTAVATGTAGHYRLYASDGTTCHEQGTITATGGGGDMTIDNTSINSGQTVNVTGWTWTEPGA
ncbi:MAG: hypothetical protein JO051_03420 [Acidobacteriaceae bacterium]|nr:hypothetical protein [Acidobacteriaceae bacterium]